MFCDLGRKAHKLQTDCGPARLRLCLVDRSHREIVDRFGPGGNDLGARMRGHPDNRRLRKYPARPPSGKVVLADMNSAPECKGDIGPVVHNEWNSHVRARGGDRLGRPDEITCLELFLAQLHEVHSGASELTHEVGKRSGRELGSGYEVETAIGKTHNAAAAVPLPSPFSGASGSSPASRS